MAIAATVAVLCGSHPTFLRDHFALHQETLGPVKTVSGVVYLAYFATALKSGGKLSVGSREVALGPD
jgi:hypothetical protein